MSMHADTNLSIEAGTESVVRVAVGLNDPKAPHHDSDGDAPMILAFNENEEWIGKSPGVPLDEISIIGNGSFSESPSSFYLPYFLGSRTNMFSCRKICRRRTLIAGSALQKTS